MRLSFCTLAILIMLIPITPATAGEWRVTPIRIDLGKDARTGSVSIVNDGPDRINFEVKLFEWTQTPEGKDQYTESQDITFFPKILSVEGKGERVVRTGITSPPVSTEKSYRLFIEELPQPRQDNQTAVSIVVRFGIPVFVKPLKEEKKGVIDSPRIGPTSLSTVIRNTGSVNLHLKNVIFTGRDKQGQEIFRRETQGGYLLVGTARPYSAAITPDECRSIASFEIEANNDKIPLNTTTLVDRSLCGP